jgi:hypothetical protein
LGLLPRGRGRHQCCCHSFQRLVPGCHDCCFRQCSKVKV